MLPVYVETGADTENVGRRQHLAFSHPEFENQAVEERGIILLEEREHSTGCGAGLEGTTW